jgi:hypothetical protein
MTCSKSLWRPCLLKLTALPTSAMISSILTWLLMKSTWLRSCSFWLCVETLAYPMVFFDVWLISAESSSTMVGEVSAPLVKSTKANRRCPPGVLMVLTFRCLAQVLAVAGHTPRSFAALTADTQVSLGSCIGWLWLLGSWTAYQRGSSENDWRWVSLNGIIPGSHSTTCVWLSLASQSVDGADDLLPGRARAARRLGDLRRAARRFGEGGRPPQRRWPPQAQKASSSRLSPPVACEGGGGGHFPQDQAREHVG